MKVSFLKESEIEAEANHLIKLYEAKKGNIQGYMIPVDEIAELTLGYHLDIKDLTKEFTEAEVNGYIDFDNNSIAIHEGLEPTENPSYIGRFNSTIGHECGHAVLHKTQFIASRKQDNLFYSNEPNLILCRKKDANESIEWQADCFSSYLTMPKDKMYKLWVESFGSLKPTLKSDFRIKFNPETALSRSIDELVEISLSDFARSKVGVSSQALRIRLEKLGLLVSNKLSVEAYESAFA
jgi:Zn-dependent peptidase ImmA (M78 family)